MHDLPETRNSLLLRLAEPADQVAWADFVKIYEPVIIRMAMHRGLQISDAQDLSQEVLSRVAKSVGKWNPERERGTFRGWLSRVTRNLVIDHFRKNSRMPAALLDSAVSEEGATPDDSLFDLEERRQIFYWAGEQARKSFSETTWKAFWASCVDHMSPQKTAQHLNLSVGAVYIARSRVMAKIRSIIESTDFENKHWEQNNEG